MRMRPLWYTETTKVFDKLRKFIGDNNLNNIVEAVSFEGDDPVPTRYCFRIIDSKVYYVRESVVRRAANLGRDDIVTNGGTNIGEFSKKKRFSLSIESLNLLAAYALHKVWLKPHSEMSFLRNENVLKGGVENITDGIVEGDGVVVFSSTTPQFPLGFGIATRSARDNWNAGPKRTMVLHLANIS